jgi:ArsR family transcriptional regulator
MMATTTIEAGLIPRLERLTGADGACCIPDYRERAQGITRNRRFSVTLARVRALADESRLTAVALLRRSRELCACEIQAALGVTHATVSHHMRILERAEIVSSERRGHWTYYRLRHDAAVEIP